jgi:23S rRNA pseudouridine1911/1915/1917 synthase
MPSKHSSASKQHSGQAWQVSEQEEGWRLDKWLAAAERLGSRSRALAAIERGKVLLDGDEQTSGDAGRRLRAGETIRLWMDRPGTSKRRPITGRRASGLDIIYEDDALLVIAKPAGLLTVALGVQPHEPSLADKVAQHLRSQGKRRPLTVHRIDRDTSGLVVFAKTPQAQTRLKAQFERREPERIYWAVVYGCPQPGAGSWRDSLVWDRQYLVQKPARGHEARAQEAVSHYRVLEEFEGASLIEVRLVTGKRNQIRMQAGRRGHPLVGERQYLFEPAPRQLIDFPRQALHAYRLGFQHPADGRALSCEAPLPEDFQTLLDRLRAQRRQRSAKPPDEAL